MDVAEKVVGLPLLDLRCVNVGQRSGVLVPVVEAVQACDVILDKERGWVLQRVQAPDDLVPRERLRLAARVVFRRRGDSCNGGGQRAR